MSLRTLAATLLLASSALARTDLVGCTYTDTVVKPSSGPAYGERVWYVPGTGELCDFLDCGGGRAPPKTNVPGCPLYKGTSTYSPSYLDLKTAEGKAAVSVTTATATATATATNSVEASATATSVIGTTLSSVVSVTATATDSGSVITSAASTVSGVASSLAGIPAQGTITGGLKGNSTASASGVKPTNTINGAAPAAAGILGSGLVAGIAALAML